jgi:hypothetical protein
MDVELQEAKRDGDILKVLRIMKRSGPLYVDQVVETGATPEQVADAFELQLPFGHQATLLAALYNHAKTQGMGFMRAKMDHIMTWDEARITLMLGSPRFDYLRGRVMKVNVADAAPRTDLYDRDNGPGAYARARGCKGCAKCST